MDKTWHPGKILPHPGILHGPRATGANVRFEFVIIFQRDAFSLFPFFPVSLFHPSKEGLYNLGSFIKRGELIK